MPVAYNVLLILSFLTETMAAVSLIGGPDGLSAAGRGEMWSMHYGFAALAIASSSLWAWPQRKSLPAVTLMLGLMSVFHTGLAISLLTAGDQQVGLILHTILAVLALSLATQRRKIAS
jgi:hypothetical protein